jgi:hypothetical protein
MASISIPPTFLNLFSIVIIIMMIVEINYRLFILQIDSQGIIFKVITIMKKATTTDYH